MESHILPTYSPVSSVSEAGLGVPVRISTSGQHEASPLHCPEGQDVPKEWWFLLRLAQLCVLGPRAPGSELRLPETIECLIICKTTGRKLKIRTLLLGQEGGPQRKEKRREWKLFLDHLLYVTYCETQTFS
jgi:hypothetical protein